MIVSLIECGNLETLLNNRENLDMSAKSVLCM